MENSSEKIAVRDSQVDPLVMYLIHNESITMGMGKFAAQCGHAVGMLDQRFYKLKRDNFVGWSEPTDVEVFEQWLNESFRKVVLKANAKEWIKLKELPNYVLVVDSGLTEIAPGSETFIGLWPMRKSQVPKLIKRLQAVK